jgi:TolB-like protein
MTRNRWPLWRYALRRRLERLRRLAVTIHERAIWQALAVFLGASVALLEVVDVLISRLGLPDGLFPLALVLLMIGLPIVVLTAWVQTEEDGAASPGRSPSGRSSSAPGAGSAPAERGKEFARILTWRNALGGGVLAFAAWGVIAATGAMTGFLDHRPAPDVAAASAYPVPTEGDAEEPLPLTSVAVLYFDDFSPRQDLEYLARGLTEALIHELAQVPALRVASRNGVKPFMDPDIPIDSIARMLRVGSLVEGSLEPVAGGGLRVTVQLIDGNDGSHLMSRRVERHGSDLLALRDEVVDEVIFALRSRLGESVHRMRSRAATTSPEAWELVQRAAQLRADADDLWVAGDTARTLASLEEAEQLLAEAEALDPDWPEPVVLRGSVVSSIGIRRGSEYGAYADSAGAVALAHAERALARWPDNAEALSLRGGIRARMWEHAEDPGEAQRLRAGAEADLEAAVALDPGLARAWAALSRIRRQYGDFAAAKVAAERAYAVDAYLEEAALVLFNLCHISIELKEFAEGERWCAEGARRFPGDGYFIEPQLVLLASDIAVEPDVQRAETLLEALLDHFAPSEARSLEPVYEMYRAAVLARAGFEDSARSVIRRAREDPTAGGNPSLDYYEANARLRLGEPEQAIRRLASYLEASPGSRDYIAKDWWWEDLHDQPAFRALVEEEGG